MLKKVLYEKVVVPTVMYGSESWGMKVTERQKLNVFDVRCRGVWLVYLGWMGLGMK